MKEIWKDVCGYEGLYQVSNFGRVRSLDRVCAQAGITKTYCDHYIKKGKILKLNKRHTFVVVAEGIEEERQAGGSDGSTRNAFGALAL